MIELRLGREVGVQDPLPVRRTAGAGHHFRQAVIRLGPQHDVHLGGAPQYFRAFGLSHAPCHGQDHPPPLGATGLLENLKAAQLGKHLVSRFLPDVAGVENHHIGSVRTIGQGVAKGR